TAGRKAEVEALESDLKVLNRMEEESARFGQAVGLDSASTFECIVDRDRHFFMEVNTRIQVEHPVTEMVTGIDLIKEQIRIAGGQKLRFQQEDIKIRGAAIECRINAEDFENNFMPCPGKIETLNLPGGPGIRVDTHIYPGYEISPYYDSLVAKIISHGNNRKEAVKIMKRALDEFIIAHIKTTVPFHAKLLANPLFIKGEFTTHFVQEMFKETKPEE
ncbi:MAG: acetyl-CoA carboxylase biotin carboxylase subunit, partial [Nitrospirota bacterium]|nr:acetyl-CoA carboxylase biotin carboxylase subunit [Nitrospirota bacterium]